MLTKILRTIRTVIIILLSLLLFGVVIDLMQAYQTLKYVHPVLGTLFALTLATGFLALVIWYIISLWRYPMTLRPPPCQELDKANMQELRAYGRYIRKVMRRLSHNEMLTETNRLALESEDGRLREVLVKKSELTPMIDAIRNVEELHIQPSIEMLDKLAEREVRGSVRDIMLGVTLSPWRTIDLFVVLYRNAGMVVRITGIYNNRPRLREHFQIMIDVVSVVAMVNFLNYGSKLMQNLLTSAPFLGRFTDDVVQGVGAGLMTSVTGHAAQMRCQTFHGWNEKEAQATLRKQLGRFLVDIKKIVFDDVLSELYKPVKALNPDITRDSGWLDHLRDEVAVAIDDTTKGMDYYIKRPTVAAGRGFAKKGSDITESTISGIQSGGTSTLASVNKMGKMLGSGIVWIGRKVGNIAEATEQMKSDREKLENSQDSDTSASPNNSSVDIGSSDADKEARLVGDDHLNHTKSK